MRVFPRYAGADWNIPLLSADKKVAAQLTTPALAHAHKGALFSAVYYSVRTGVQTSIQEYRPVLSVIPILTNVSSLLGIKNWHI